MENILLSLQRLFQESSRLEYVRDNSIIIAEVLADILDIPLTMYPAIQIMPGPENPINSTRETFLDGKEIIIIIANHYLNTNTILFGDKRIVGILKFLVDIKQTISDVPKLYGNSLGWLPVSRRVTPVILDSPVDTYTRGRMINLTYKTIESVNAG